MADRVALILGGVYIEVHFDAFARIETSPWIKLEQYDVRAHGGGFNGRATGEPAKDAGEKSRIESTGVSDNKPGLITAGDGDGRQRGDGAQRGLDSGGSGIESDRGRGVVAVIGRMPGAIA